MALKEPQDHDRGNARGNGIHELSLGRQAQNNKHYEYAKVLSTLEQWELICNLGKYLKYPFRVSNLIGSEVRRRRALSSLRSGQARSHTVNILLANHFDVVPCATDVIPPNLVSGLECSVKYGSHDSTTLYFAGNDSLPQLQLASQQSLLAPSSLSDTTVKHDTVVLFALSYFRQPCLPLP